MAVTIRDVAEAAGVSPMAVSKVLHGKGSNVRVGQETADIIRRVARELHYQPNELARSFRLQRTFMIGLVFEDWTRVAGGSQYFAHLLDGVTSASFPGGYSVSICPQLVNIESGSTLNDRRFDGLIWAKFESSPENFKMLESSRTPIVILHANSPSIVERGVSTFCCDNSQALRLAVDHLVGLGHRRIGMVVHQPKDHDDETVARVSSCRAALAAHGLRLDDADLLNWEFQAEEFEAWWRSGPPHTALILRSEAQAGPIVAHAARFGVRLPEDLSLVGFDSTAYCDTLSPRLTAIKQPIEEMAFEATQLLMRIIEGAAAPAREVVFACGFDVRESTAPPRSAT